MENYEKGYLRKEDHDEACEDKWERNEEWKHDQTRRDDERWKVIKEEIKYVKEAIEGKDGINVKLAVLMESFKTVRSVVFGAVAFIGFAFLATLIVYIGWKK